MVRCRVKTNTDLARMPFAPGRRVAIRAGVLKWQVVESSLPFSLESGLSNRQTAISRGNRRPPGPFRNVWRNWMNTVWAIFVALGLFCWCGTGIALLFIKERRASRLAAIPAIGLCAGVLFTLFLARFGLPGRTIALITLVFFGIFNAVVCWRCRPRPSRLEFLSTLPVVSCCVGGLVMAAWPLLQVGMENYWGFANPDHAFYIPIIEYVDSHSFRVAPSEFLGVFHSLGNSEILSIAYDTSVILGLSYFFSMLGLLTGIPVQLLFWRRYRCGSGDYSSVCLRSLRSRPVATQALFDGGFGSGSL